MITLQQLLMTDSDPSGGTLAGKGAEGAQDFLSAGGRADRDHRQRQRCSADAGRSKSGGQQARQRHRKNGDTTLRAKIAELLSRQETLTDEDTAVSLQSLVSGLKPAANTDALKALTQPEAKQTARPRLKKRSWSVKRADGDVTAPADHHPGSDAACEHREIAPRATLPSALAQTDNGQHQPLSHALTGQEKCRYRTATPRCPPRQPLRQPSPPSRRSRT